jgi:hypothetical protein
MRPEAAGEQRRCRSAPLSQLLSPLDGEQLTLGCQLTNAPFGLCFHAQTCSM